MSESLETRVEANAESIRELLPYLRRRARFLERDESAADDLVQETLERAFRFTDTFRQGSSFKSWVLSIQKNAFLTKKRKGSVEYRGRARLAFEAKVSEDFVDGLEATQVFEAVSELPESFREVLLLVLVHEYSYAEAAVELNVPVGTVMSRLYRAKERLRAVLMARDPAFLRVPVYRPKSRSATSI